MSHEKNPGPSISLQFEMDAVCDAFEDAWKTGDTEPDLRSLLDGLGPRIRELAASELFLLDHYYRNARGKFKGKQEYLQQYPDFVAAIERAFHPREAAMVDETIFTKTTSETPTTPGMATLGDRVTYFGDYELLSEIARGGMGVVYRARQISLNRIIALKMILSGQLASDSQIRRFQLEAESAANMDHPGIVPIYDIGRHQDQHYFSMKLIEGASLSDRSEEYSKDPKAAVELVAKIADAMHHAHQRGVLHRDLKPSNILIDSGGQPVVTDFGLARQTESNHDLTQSGDVVGTPGFMSPEQAAGNTVTTATDIYSLGAILYRLVCGQPPHAKPRVMETLMSVIKDPPERPSKHNAEVSPDLELIMLKCLSKQSNDRYASAAEFASELRAFSEGRPLQVRAPSLLELVRMWLASNYGSIVWLPIIAMVTGIVSGISFWYASTPTRMLPLLKIYREIAPAERPSWIVAPIEFWPIMWGIFFLSVTMFGWFTAKWVKTKNASADVGAGLSVGLLTGLVALITTFGPMMAMVHVSSASSDLDLLHGMAESTEQLDLGEVTSKYPALLGKDRTTIAFTLKKKYQGDVLLAILKGTWFGAFLIVVAMAFLGTIETWVAGPLIRDQSRRRAITSYICFAIALVAGSFVPWSEAVIRLIHNGFGYIVEWKLPVVVIATSLFTVMSIVRRWPLVAQLVSAGVCASVFISFVTPYVSWVDAAHFAYCRSNIHRASELYQRDSQNADNQLRLSLAHVEYAHGLHANGWNDQAFTHFEQALSAVNKLGQDDLSEPVVLDLVTKLDSATFGDVRQVVYRMAIVDAIESDQVEQAVQWWVRGSELFELKHHNNMAVATNLVKANRVSEFLKLAKGRQSNWRVARLIQAINQAKIKQPGMDVISYQSWLTKTIAETIPNDEAKQEQFREWMAGIRNWIIYHADPVASNDDAVAALVSMSKAESSLTSSSTVESALKVVGTLSVTNGLPVDLGQYLGETEHAVGFAKSTLYLENSVAIKFLVSSDEPFMMWIDGKEVYQSSESKVFHIREAEVQVQLDAGEHQLLIRSVLDAATSEFTIDALDESGFPLDVWKS